ncbi:MAG: hypothetical protein V3V40_06535 [Nitrosomonadaceae bacterium]
MAFDLATAQPASSGSFDLSTAKPVVEEAVPVPAEPQPGIGEQILGALDTAKMIGIAGIGEAAGGFAAGVAGGIPGITSGVGPKRAEEIQKYITDFTAMRPLTEQGKRNLEAIGNNEFVKQVADLVQSAERISGEFGFDAGTFIGEVTGFDNLGAIGGALGAAVPAAVGAVVGAGPGAQVAKAAGRTIKDIAGPAIQAASKPIEAAGKELATIAQDTRVIMAPQQAAAKQKIGRLISVGSGDVSTALFKLDPKARRGDNRVIPDDLAQETIKQGFEERAIASAKVANQPTKTKFLEMVDVMEGGQRNARYAAQNRPADVIGRSVGDRVKVLMAANKEAGKALDSKNIENILKGKKVETDSIGASFIDDLEEMGIKSTDEAGNPLRDKDGKLILEFYGSDIETIPGLKRVISNVYDRMQRGGAPDALELHKVKRMIDSKVSFGKKLQGLSGNTERILQNLRRNIDQQLDNNFDEYRKINDVYSETIGALDALQEVFGKKVDMDAKSGENAMGNRMRGVLSNNVNKELLKAAAEQADTIAKKYEHGAGLIKRIGPTPKTKLNDDLLDQVVFVDELDRRFGTLATTGFQGQIKQGVEQAGRALASKSGMADVAVSKVAQFAEKKRGITDDNAFKAIRDLLMQ